MALKIAKTIHPATPWNVSIAKLTSLEHKIVSTEGEAMTARWTFGCELVRRRIDYKGRLVVPRDLMALVLDKCGLTRSEVNYRVQFATRYPTKALMSNAVGHYPSWHQMTSKGLVEKSRAPAKKSSTPASSWHRVVHRLAAELDKASAHHRVLTRDQVKELEQLSTQIRAILDHVDQNDAARAS